MAVKTIDAGKKFNIYSSFTLSSDDVSVLSMLYAPLMGSDALMIYLGFTSLLERNNLKSETLIHQDFFDMYSLNASSFLKARYKLEGICLLMTYETAEKDLIYVLCPPLTAKSFIKDATLGIYLYSKIRKETFDFIYNHFKIEKIDKANCTNLTKSFDDVYSSQLTNDLAFDKFQIILGKKPNGTVKIKDYKFDFNYFLKEINKDLLENGVTKAFETQVCQLSFVYGFDEIEMVNLYHESINKSGFYDYRLLKTKSNTYFIYKRNLKAPKLVAKVDMDQTIQNDDLISYLENTSPNDLLEDVCPNYPEKYLKIITDIYASIDLPRGVLNCMILKVMKEKSGELPPFSYFKKVSESWIRDKVFSTADAIKYVTTLKNDFEQTKNNNSNNNNGGFEEL